MYVVVSSCDPPIVNVLHYLLVFQLTLAKAFAMDVNTYSGLAVALFCLAVAFVLFWFVRGIDSNANSIRTNLVASLFVAYAAFIAGIDRADPTVQVVNISKTVTFLVFVGMKMTMYAC